MTASKRRPPRWIFRASTARAASRPAVPKMTAPSAESRARKPRRQPEAAIQARILLALQREWPEALWWINKTGTAWTKDGSRPVTYGLKGSSDILGCLSGLMICVEVKTADGRQEESQVRFEAAIRKAGGVYLISRSPTEAIEGIRSALQ